MDFSIEKSLFGGSGPVSIILKDKIDELEPDIQFNNKIKIYSRNKWSSALRLIYYGYITSIDPVVRQGEQQTGITCLGAISKLQNDYLRTGTDLAYEVGPLDIDDHIKTILDHYRESVKDLGSGNYATSMIAETDYFPSGASPDSSVVANTSGIGTIPYRFFNLKHLESIREIGKFLPKNDYGDAFWFYYLNDEGKFYLKKLTLPANSPDHRLQLNKHLVSLDARKNMEGVVNKVFFWNEKGMEGEMVRTVYDDSNSQENFDIIADRVTDAQVSTYLQARLLAEGKKDESKDVAVEATAIVSEANFDILSFKLGDVVDILDQKDPTLLRKLILSGTATDGSTTTCVDTTRTEDTDDYWKYYYIKFITGDNANKVREITGFAEATDTISFRALDENVAATDKYEIYTKTTRLIIEKIILTPRNAVLELATPRPDLTTQVETDRAYIDKQLKWFGEILTRIDGTRVSSGIQHWLTDDVEFTPNVASPNDTMDWSTGTFYLPNDVRRVISSGTSSAMAVTDPVTKYYFFIDEATCYYTDSYSIRSTTGSVKEGETFLSDSGESWHPDEYKGYILVIDPEGADEERHIITRNTATFLYVEAHDPIDITDASVTYEIHKFQLRETNDRGTGSLLLSGATIKATGGNTTTLIDTVNLTQATDIWSGYEIKFLSGDNRGLTRAITAFNVGTHTLTFDKALPNDVAVDDLYTLYISSDTRIIIMAGEGFATENVKMDSQQATTIPDHINRGASRAFDALDISNNLVRDITNARLNSSTKKILSDFNFGATDYAGAVKAGDITWNTTTGAITGGSGIAIYRKGIVGATAGVTTFSIDATTGDAVFLGTITAGAGSTVDWSYIQNVAIVNADIVNLSADKINAGTLTVGYTEAKCTDANADQTSANPQNVAWLTDAGAVAYYNTVEAAMEDETIIVGGYIATSFLTANNILAGTLTARTVRTGSSGQRVELIRHGDPSYPDQLLFYDSNENVMGDMWAEPGKLVVGFFPASTVDFYGVNTELTYFRIGNTEVECGANLVPMSGMGFQDLGSSSKQWYNLYLSSWAKTGTLYPRTTNAYDVGSNTYQWRHIYLRDSLRFDYESDCYITQITNGGTPFMRLKFEANGGHIRSSRHIIPSEYSPTCTYDLGKATRKWRNGYFCNIYYTGGSLPDTLDDIALIKKISPQNYEGKSHSIGDQIALLIGAIKQLSERVEKLETA